MFVFSQGPGRIGVSITGGGLPFAIGIGGNPSVPAFPAYLLSKAILTGFQLGNRSGLNLSHTLRDRIYAYVFGEKAGRAMISGIAFPDACGAAPGLWTGLDAVYAYYEVVRVSQRGLPATLIFGPNTALVGLLSDFGFSLEDAQTGIGQFGFTFQTFPRNAVFGLVPPLPWQGVQDVELTAG